MLQIIKVHKILVTLFRLKPLCKALCQIQQHPRCLPGPLQISKHVLQRVKGVQFLHFFDSCLDPVTTAGHIGLLFRVHLFAAHRGQTAKSGTSKNLIKGRKIFRLRKPF